MSFKTVDLFNSGSQKISNKNYDSALQQVQAYEKRAVDELDLQNRNTEEAIEQKRGITNFLKMNPLAGLGAAAALFCLGKGMGEFGYRGKFSFLTSFFFVES